MTKTIISKALCFTILFFTIINLNAQERFNKENDLLLGQFDCKTDVDDLHTIAAFYTLFSNSEFKDINYFGVAGTYGIQDGLYVPPNDLMKLAFNKNWTDAHANFDKAVKKVKKIVLKTLKNDGDIWIAEAGQSDFSAALVKELQKELPELKTTERIHIVQHSNWNEDVTDPNSLEFVKTHTDYHKIPDGNAVGNGTPGFNSPEFTNWNEKIEDPRLKVVWQLAVDLGMKYNGKDGRYNNGAISEGGLDFSDLSEVCYILGLEGIKDIEEFFNLYAY